MYVALPSPFLEFKVGISLEKSSDFVQETQPILSFLQAKRSFIKKLKIASLCVGLDTQEENKRKNRAEISTISALIRRNKNRVEIRSIT